MRKQRTHFYKAFKANAVKLSLESWYKALIYEINQPSFQNTSEYYRSNTMYQYNSYIPSGYNYPSSNYDPSGNY